MKPKALCVVLLPVVAVGTYCLWPSSPAKNTAAPASATAKHDAAPAAGSSKSDAGAPASAVTAQELDVAIAVQRQVIAAEFTGNGRDRVQLVALN